MDLKERLTTIINNNNLNASSFADKLNIQRSNLSHILSGRNKPSLDFIEKFISKFPNEDVIWLITGNKSDKNKTQNDNPELKPNNLKFNQESENNQKQIPENKDLKITKIITFYENNTFDIYQANS